MDPSKCAPRLSRRETEIAALAATGLSCAEIAECLLVSVNTVKTHLSHVYLKAGVVTESSWNTM